eukprot:gb/GEZN01003498.1/.p1 GENE.gb/GEZN01003498.1/~~gb/GEZN01003498.1/.p1  ORF type:complete len:294 (-),score=48.50 gb/GEZN01003498.1/:436-1317(-)
MQALNYDINEDPLMTQQELLPPPPKGLGLGKIAKLVGVAALVFAGGFLTKHLVGIEHEAASVMFTASQESGVKVSNYDFEEKKDDGNDDSDCASLDACQLYNRANGGLLLQAKVRTSSGKIFEGQLMDMSPCAQGVAAVLNSVQVNFQLPFNVTGNSGCGPRDFKGFIPGSLALVQRGTCFFNVKARNAQKAGAKGIVIFNQGNAFDEETVGQRVGSRFETVAGTLNTSVGCNGNNGVTIPTIGISFADGQLLNSIAAEGGLVTLWATPTNPGPMDAEEADKDNTAAQKLSAF